MNDETKTTSKKGKATELSFKVAEILAELRGAHNLSQREFAESIGVSFQQYQKYEKGRDRLSLEKAMLLCNHLGLPLTVFMEGITITSGFGESEQEGFGPQPVTVTGAEEKELLELFARVPKKNKQQFLETVRQLAKMA